MADKGLPDRPDLLGANIFDGTFPLPTAVLLREELAHNLATMASYCADHDVLLAPHGKTTMSPEIIRRQLDAGAWAITVATAWQAATVTGMGVRNVVLANQVVDAGSLRLLDGLLAADPDLRLHCLVDSAPGLAALEDAIAAPHRPRLRVLIELGTPGGRTGLRDDAAAMDLASRVATGAFALGGFGAFEGILAASTLDGTLALVDRLLDRLVAVARRAHADHITVPDPIVTVGGSAYFDRVVARIPAALADTPYRTVLRSGCYVTHDAGSYDASSAFGAHPREPYRLKPALLVWAAVLSRPEPGLALAGLGRRDASADAGLPIPRTVRTRAGHESVLAPAVTVTAVNDQHAYLSVPADHPLRVGDLVSFDISHPCTTFDKWRTIPVVDPHGTIVELVHTRF